MYIAKKYQVTNNLIFKIGKNVILAMRILQIYCLFRIFIKLKIGVLKLFKQHCFVCEKHPFLTVKVAEIKQGVCEVLLFENYIQNKCQIKNK